MADTRQAVLTVIRETGPIALRDIQRLTGLGHTTVGAVVADLRAQGAVIEVEADRTRGRPATGRPPIHVAINPDLAVVIGIQFEHTHVRAAMADLSLSIMDERMLAMQVSADAQRALSVGAEMIEALIDKQRVPRRQVIGVATALAAPIDGSSGTVRSTGALRDWVGRQPAVDLARALKLPVIVGNDATLAGFGEAVVGAAKGSQHVVYVKLSASIGCGIVIGGRPYGGATGTAGELAHMVVDDRGALCFCGNRGCLWLMVGAEGILTDLLPSRRHQLQEIADRTYDEQLLQVIDWARNHDSACQQKLREVATTVGAALVSVCNLLNPETIVVGGVLSQAGEMLFGPLRERVHTYTRDIAPRPVRIVPPVLGDRAEVLGAAALVLRGGVPAFAQRLQDLIG